MTDTKASGRWGNRWRTTFGTGRIVLAAVAGFGSTAHADDDTSDPLVDPIAQFERAPSLNVASPPFEARAVAEGMSWLQLQTQYNTWASDSDPLLDLRTIVTLQQTRLATIWSGRTVVDWSQHDLTPEGHEVPNSLMDLVCGAELEWSGNQFRSHVTRHRGSVAGASAIVGHVVSNGRESIVLDMSGEQSAQFGPITVPILQRSRFSRFHLVSLAQTARSTPDIGLGRFADTRVDVASHFLDAMNLGALFLLPELIVLNGIETLVVIDMSSGGQLYYYLSVEHDLAIVRMDVFRLHFSETGAYQGRELMMVRTFDGLQDAGDGIYLPETVQSVSRVRRGIGPLADREVVYIYSGCDVGQAEINCGIPDRTFYIHHAARGRIIEDRIRGLRWAFNADGVPDVGEAILLASDLRHGVNAEAGDKGTLGVQSSAADEGRHPVNLEMIEGFREGMMCTVVAGFVALHQLGFEVSMQDVAAQIGWESGSPRTARDMADAMAALAGVHSDLRMVTRDEVDELLASEGTAVLLLLDLESGDVGHVCAVIGSEADGSLITAEYPQMQRHLTLDELAERWTGEVLVVSHTAADVTAPVTKATARVPYLVGAAVALAAGLAMLLVGRKSRREVAPC